MTQINSLRLRWDKAIAVSGFGSRVALTLLTNLAIGFLALVSGLLAARSLGPLGRGELAAIQTWPTFLATVAMLGIPEALVYYSARQSKTSGRLLGTSILVALITGVPFILAGYLLMPYLLMAQSPEIISAARNYLWLIPLMACVGMMPNVLRGRNDISAWNLLRILPPIVWVIVLILSIITSKPHPQLITSSYLVGFALLLVPYAIMINRRVPGPFMLSRGFIYPILSYGLPLMLSIFPYTLNLRLGQMLMGGLYEPQTLGYYVVAVAWSSAVLPLLSVLPSVLMPQVAGMIDRYEQIDNLARIIRLGSLFAVLISFIVFIITPLLLPLLFGSAYKPAVPAAMILSLASGVFGINALMEAGAQSLGKPKLILLAESIGLCATILFLWILMRPYLILGAALTSLISYSTIMVILIWQIHRSTGLSFTAILVINRADLVVLWENGRSLWLALNSKGPDL